MARKTDVLSNTFSTTLSCDFTVCVDQGHSGVSRSIFGLRPRVCWCHWMQQSRSSWWVTSLVTHPAVRPSTHWGVAALQPSVAVARHLARQLHALHLVALKAPVCNLLFCSNTCCQHRLHIIFLAVFLLFYEQCRNLWVFSMFPLAYIWYEIAFVWFFFTRISGVHCSCSVRVLQVVQKIVSFSFLFLYCALV